MSTTRGEGTLGEPFEQRLRSYYRSIQSEPPAGLEARIDRAMSQTTPTGSNGGGGLLRGRGWQPFAGLGIAAVVVLAAALIIAPMYLGPAPTPSGAVGPSVAPSPSESLIPSGMAGSPEPTSSAGESAEATSSPTATPTATPTPTPIETPVPVVTPIRGTGSLAALPAMSPYLSGPSVNLDGAHILVAGGMTTNAGGIRIKSNLAEIFNEGGHTWTATGSMNDARYDHTITLLRDDRVLVTGGADLSDGIDNLATAEIYDPTTGTWTRTGSMSHGRAAHTATLLLDGRVLITGGFGGGTLPTSTAEIYDPATGQFTPTGSMTVARMKHTATMLLGGSVLITGGEDDNGNVLSSAEIWSPATGKFTATGSMSTPRDWHTATTLGDDRVLIVGGSRGSASGPVTLRTAEIYNPATGRFTATGSMVTARYSHTATLLNTGQVVVAGGNGTDSLEVYWPDTGKFGYGQALAGAIDSAASLADRVLLTGTAPVIYCPWPASHSACQ